MSRSLLTLRIEVAVDWLHVFDFDFCVEVGGEVVCDCGVSALLHYDVLDVEVEFSQDAVLDKRPGDLFVEHHQLASSARLFLYQQELYLLGTHELGLHLRSISEFLNDIGDFAVLDVPRKL